MSNIIGIDLGTTNSVIAHLDKWGIPRVLPADEGHNLMPSVVCFGGENVQVGTHAKRMEDLRNPGVVAEFKRYMGDDKTYNANGVQTTPVELSSRVLKKLADYAKQEVGDFDASTVTVPANWNNKGRMATRKASVDAGLKIGPMINEPSAAALYYWLNDRIAPGFYYIYDFGGGTWDLSYVEISDDRLQTITSNGIPKCGGTDFDESIRQLVISKFESQTGLVLNEAESGLTAITYETAKKNLTNELAVKLRVPYSGSSFPADIEITRDEFEESIRELLVQTEAYCRTTLGSYPDFEDVLLVGGSTRVPKVKESIEKVFGKKPITVGNPDEAVALGAAIHAAQYADPTGLTAEQRNIVEGLRLRTEVSNHYYGFVARRSSEDKRVVFTVIPKDTVIPCSTITENYVLQYDGQDNANLTVTQSMFEEEDPSEVTTIYDGTLSLEPGTGHKGDIIKIIYSYSADEIMSCSFEHIASGQNHQVNLDTSGYVIEPLNQPTAVPPEPKVSTETSKVGMQIWAGYCPTCKRVVDFIRENGSISSDDWHCEYCQEKMPVI